MKKLLLILGLTLSVFANDIIIKNSECSVDKTIKKISKILNVKGLTIFSVVDHHKNAKGVDMKMGESKLIIFGNPKLGSSLMKQDMTIGLDLPMKILVYKDKDAQVKMAFRNGTWMAKEHSLSMPKREKKMNGAMNKITNKAGTCKKD